MKKKTNIHLFVMRLAAVLLSLVMLTGGMVSGRYARYATGATGSDSARVAKFNVTKQSIEHGGTDLTTTVPMPEIGPGEKETVYVVVTYSAEVAVRNTISVASKYNNLPLVFKIGEKGTALTVGDFTGEYSYGDNVTNVYEVQIHWPEGENSQQYIGMVDLLTITVTTEQID